MATFNENEDTITDMVMNQEKNKLLATSNDGFLTVFDIRRASSNDSASGGFTLDNPKSKFKPSLFAMSDCMDEELTSLQIMKCGKKVVVGTQEGVVMLFTWDWFGDCDDRITSHPCSVSSMAMYNEDIVITGCDDGYVRAINLLPNKIISVVNYDADEEDLMPVSKIAIKDNIAAFTCNDEMVRIYDLEQFEQKGEDEEPTEVESSEMANNKNASDEEMKYDSDADKEWDDIEDEIDSESSGNDNEEEEKEQEKPSKGLYYSGQDIRWSKNKSDIEKHKRQAFFSDM